MNKVSSVGFICRRSFTYCKSLKLLIALLTLASFEVSAANSPAERSTTSKEVQQNKITGTVKSESGEPLIGATVQIKGTTTGTVTDIDGRFSLNSTAPNVTLIISYVGFEAVEVAASSASPSEIKIKELTTGLDEIVVIGYGVQKKKLVTGATVQVSGDDLQKQSTTNAIQALQGKTPGVQITSTSGQPGEGIKVTVRGLGTIGSGGPLYIVDGIVTDNISYLNNSDIESIDILKDAASAAIYGSRAANGVVLVTTKQGKSGKSQVTFDAYYGIQNTPKKFELSDAKQYAILMNEQYLNGGGNATTLPFNVNKLSANTDWLGEMYTSNAVTQNYTLGITGGDDKSKYSMAVGYTGQEGIVGKSNMSNYDRYNGRFNSEHNLYNDILKVGQHLNYSFEKKNGIGVGNIYGNNLRSAYNTSPLLPMYNADGSDFENSAAKVINPTTNKEENKYLFNGQSNPYANMVYNNQSENNNQKIIGDIYAELKPFSGLSIRTTFGIDQRTSESRSFRPIYTLSMYNFSNETRITQYQSNNFKYTWSNYADYAFELADNKFDFMVGTSFEKDHGVYINGANTNSSFYDFDHAYLSNALNKDGSKITIEGKPFTDCILSYFGRFQYNYKETYMLNGTMRADGSSNFAEGNKWGYFPSVSAGWVMSNEAFMESTQQVMDFFKLRASWGQNGNQAIDRFQYVAPIQFTNATYGFGSAEGATTQVNGSYPNRASNPKLKWETSEQYDFGFDARFLKSKLSVNFDVYQKSTKDWLLLPPISGTAGVNAAFVNGGNVINKGIELGLTYNDNVGEFNYSVSANGAINKNNVTEIPTSDGIIHGSTNSLYNNAPEFYRCESGHSIGYFWGWKTDGIFQNQKEIDNYTKNGVKIQSTAKPGDVKYVDINNDGKISDLDKTDLGSPLPNFTYGFNFKCDYKGFDFALQTNGTLGNKVVQSYRDPGDQYANYSVDMYENRWHGEGTSNKYPRVTSSNINWQFSDLYVKDASFLRISNVTLGYNFSKLAKKNFIQQLRVYAAVQNLYTFTSYTGSDPEVGYGLDNGSTDKFSSGIDLGYYPRPRTYLVGVNIIF
jgi:TonB-linked SusC/RagA family outer membrane protein